MMEPLLIPTAAAAAAAAAGQRRGPQQRRIITQNNNNHLKQQQISEPTTGPCVDTTIPRRSIRNPQQRRRRRRRRSYDYYFLCDGMIKKKNMVLKVCLLLMVLVQGTFLVVWIKTRNNNYNITDREDHSDGNLVTKHLRLLWENIMSWLDGNINIIFRLTDSVIILMTMGDNDTEHGKTTTIMMKNDNFPGKTTTQSYEEIQALLKQTSQAMGFPTPFAPLLLLQNTTNHDVVTGHHPQKETNAARGDNHHHEASVQKSIQLLLEMGIPKSDLLKRVQEIPPWHQIEENFGNKPIILGLERCDTYRQYVPPQHRQLGPAGLISSGTNVLYHLLRWNCLPPREFLPPQSLLLWRRRRQQQQIQQRKSDTHNTTKEEEEVEIQQQLSKYMGKFNGWQVPWGKHNPASARLHHVAPGIKEQYRNQSATLPIVVMRHPLTWMHAICQHSYSLTWNHNPNHCKTSLSLEHPVTASLGSYTTTATTSSSSNGNGKNDTETNNNDTRNNTTRMVHPSLIHFWNAWYQEYFQQTDYPMLMIRLEDLVYHPKAVTEQVCTCAGGRLVTENNFRKFQYQQDNVNLGKGHGNDHDNNNNDNDDKNAPTFQRSDLLTAFVKFGQPLQNYWQSHHNDNVVGTKNTPSTIKSNSNSNSSRQSHRRNMYSDHDWQVIRNVFQEDDHFRQLLEAFRYNMGDWIHQI